jgi:hypothetical protein
LTGGSPSFAEPTSFLGLLGWGSSAGIEPASSSTPVDQKYWRATGAPQNRLTLVQRVT